MGLRKATKIVSVIWGVLAILSAIGCLILGITAIAAKEQIINQLIASNQITSSGDMTAQQVGETTVVFMAVLSFIGFIWTAIGIIVSFIISKKAMDESVTKSKYIGLGVVAIIFASLPVGVLSIVTGATQCKD